METIMFDTIRELLQEIVTYLVWYITEKRKGLAGRPFGFKCEWKNWLGFLKEVNEVNRLHAEGKTVVRTDVF